MAGFSLLGSGILDEFEIDDAAIVDEAVKMAEERKERLATDPDAVRALISGNVSVEDSVTVCASKPAALAFAKHVEALNTLKAKAELGYGETDVQHAERLATLQPQLDALEQSGKAVREALEAAQVTFKMVGIGKRAVKRIRASVRKDHPLPPAGTPDDPEVAELRDEEYQNRIIAAHLVADGYTPEDIDNFRDAWASREFGKLWATALKLSISDDYLSGAVDVDF